MSVSGIGTTGYPAGYETRRAERNTTSRNFAGQMGNTVTVQKSQMPSGAFELHISNDVDGRAIGAVCGSDYSVTVYEPEAFDPANPVYKVKIWDKEGNVTERMVDVSKVDPKSSDYIDMFTYSSYLTDSGKCPNAQSAFMCADGCQYGLDDKSYDDLFGGKNWIDVVKYAMQMQYDAGNIKGYLDFKTFWDFLKPV